MNFLKDLDYSVVQQCMHCGLCLPTCPTYEATRRETSSPRGRIALMRAVADGKIDATPAFAGEMYFCLGCLACETACPAGVDYTHLFEMARAEAERVGTLATPKRTWIRKILFQWLFMSRRRLRFAGRLLWFYQKLGLQTLIRKSGLLRLVPKQLHELESLTPTIANHFTPFGHQPETRNPEPETCRRRVGILAGCVQDLAFPDVNRDTIYVLEQNGCQVVVPVQQQCCGSLHAHNGEWETAKILARKNLDAFDVDTLDAIIANAAGCGSHMRHYDRLLADDPNYAERARIWSKKVRDISEYLVEIGFRKPSDGKSGPDSLRSKIRLTYHEACHLVHGQKISKQPRIILGSLPRYEMVELPEATWCCGSAGIYNITQPEMAAQLQERKIRHIISIGASLVATANPGCIIQIVSGLRCQGLQVRVAHPVTLLAEAYRPE